MLATIAFSLVATTISMAATLLVAKRVCVSAEMRFADRDDPIGGADRRPPAYTVEQTLRAERDRAHERLIPPLLTGILLLQALYGGFCATLSFGVAMLAASLTFSVWILGTHVWLRSVLRGHLEREVHLVRGMRAEQAAGWALEELMLDGVAVFHDVPLVACGNIDHVAVTRTAVFVIETKGYGRRMRGNVQGMRAAEVDNSRRTLEFPGDRTIAIPDEQVDRAMEALMEAFEAETGMTLELRSIVLIPGWSVVHRDPPRDPLVCGLKTFRQCILEADDGLDPGNRERLIAFLYRATRLQLGGDCEPTLRSATKEGASVRHATA